MMQGSTRIDQLRQKFHENPRRYFAPLANEYRKAGDAEQAIAICRAHLAQQPGHMSGHVVYGQALYDARRTDEARVAFEKALSLDPDNAIVLRHLGNIAREKGETAEARHWYSRALEADPQNTEIAAYFAELTEPITEAQSVDAEELPAEPSAEAPHETVMEAPPGPESKADEDAGTEAQVEQPDEAVRRKTPQIEQSPFVTRTMAEIYASQGHHSAALEVYRELALEHPDDAEIRDRMAELERIDSAELPSEAAASSDEQTPAEMASPDSEELQADRESVTEVNEPEAPALSHSPVEAEPFTFVDLPEASVYPPTNEDLNLIEDTGDDSGVTTHFTEADLQSADSWDSDTQGDFSGESAEEPRAEELSADAADGEATGAEEVADDSPAEIADIAEGEEESPPTTADEPHFVAYSPQLPEADELPHFTPKGPTMREFFATLGARRPPSGPPGRSFTAHAAINAPAQPHEAHAHAPEDSSGHEPQQTAEPGYPLASDAFASLFSHSSVSDEDSRAAFALSGALAAPAPEPVQQRTEPLQSPPPPAVPAAAQESEEDIRRFREWLDGLADS